MRSGVSVIICCHNGAGRLPQTLEALKHQVRTEGIPWEVLLVDNGSTDGSAAIAKETWEDQPPASLRVIPEARLGLSFARHTGLTNAAYELVSFVDDDNWVEPEWIRKVHAVMISHPEVGACGGRSIPIYESPPPGWVLDHQEMYAVGRQDSHTGDITDTRGWLWGAGLTIRTNAWQQLIDRGFKPVLTGRKGNKLTTGEDIELCMALRLAGWRIWYDDNLVLSHFIPSSRLQWNYLCRLMSTNGEAQVYLRAYGKAYRDMNLDPFEKQRIPANEDMMDHFRDFLRHHPLKLIMAKTNPLEGDLDLLYLLRSLGYLGERVSSNREYLRWVGSLKQASWRKDSTR